MGVLITRRCVIAKRSAGPLRVRVEVQVFASGTPPEVFPRAAMRDPATWAVLNLE